MTATASTTSTEKTLEVLRRFELNFNSPIDVDALMADMTDDCVFDHIAPAAASFGRHEGAAAVRAVWASLEEHFPGVQADLEDIFANGDRGVTRFVFRWTNADGSDGIMRGCDVYTMRDGKIAEKLTY